MAETIQTVISAVQRRLPDLQSSWALNLADYVHREIMAYIQGLIMTNQANPTTINLVAGTKEYSISEAQMQIDYVSYLTAAGNGTKLLETSVELLNKMDPQWRTEASGVPTQFYLSSDSTGLNIGFHPTPASSTSAGFPVVEVYGSVRPTSPLVGTSTVPSTCLNSLLYIEGISYYAAIEIRPQMAAAFKATYMEQIALNRKYVQTRSEGLKLQKISNIRYEAIPVEAGPVNNG
jgi:hypothetical protein